MKKIIVNAFSIFINVMANAQNFGNGTKTFFMGHGAY